MSKQAHIPVEGNPGLYRDSRSGAIINKNRSAAQKAREARKRFLDKENKIEELQSEMQEIKGILKQLLERM